MGFWHVYMGIEGGGGDILAPVPTNIIKIAPTTFAAFHRKVRNDNA